MMTSGIKKVKSQFHCDIILFSGHYSVPGIEGKIVAIVQICDDHL